MADRSSTGTEGRRLDRLTAIQRNVRSMLFEIGTPSSSLYSTSPNTHQTSAQRTDTNNALKSPSPRALFGLVSRSEETPYLQQNRPSYHLPLDLPGHTIDYSPASHPSEWNREPAQPSPTAQLPFRHPADTAPILDREQDLEAALPPPTRKHKKRRRKHRRRGAWVVRKGKRKGSATCMPLLQGQTRIKFISCIISGLFLASILTICTSPPSRHTAHSANC